MAAHEVSSLVRQESLPSFPFDPFGVEAYPGTVSSTIVRMTDSRAGSSSSDGEVYENWPMPRLDNYPGSIGSPSAGQTGGRSPLSLQAGALLMSPYRDNLPGSNLGPDANSEVFKQRLLDQHHHNVHLQRLRLRQQQQIQDLQEQHMRQANAELQQKIQEQQHLHEMQDGGTVLKRSVAGGGPRTKDTAFAGLMAKIVPAAISSWLSRAITASVLKKVMPEGSPVAYPQRPGEKECAYYMRTGSCAYGVSCKYDHPSWLPAGGIPNWKEGQGVDGAAVFPERPGEIECAYYIKTGDCKYGGRCKYHHPRERAGMGAVASHVQEFSGTPRANAFPMSPTAWAAPGSPFDPDHDHRISLDDSFLSQAAAAAIAAAVSSNSTPQHESHTKGAYGRPAPLNSKGLPIRLDEPDCAFYGKTGSCKYGAACKWNHPEGIVPTSPLLSSQHLSQGLNFGSNGSIDLQILTNGLSASVPGSPLSLHVYPERPGVTECTFFMKTGTCKYGSNCKYHHPRSRFSSIGGGTSGVSSPRCATPVKSPMVKLTLAGLPRREDAEVCGYYMKTGACKYGSSCKYDHPPPGEAAAKAAAAARQKESGGGSLSDSELTEVAQDGTDRWTAA